MSDEVHALDITFERIFSPQHGEPLRATWPVGYTAMVVLLFDMVVNMPETLEEAKKLTGEKAPASMTLGVVLDAGPACCRVTSDKLLELYIEAGFGLKALCDNCGETRLGSSYTTSGFQFSHVCFECVVYEMQPMQ